MNPGRHVSLSAQVSKPKRERKFKVPRNHKPTSEEEVERQFHELGTIASVSASGKDVEMRYFQKQLDEENRQSSAGIEVDFMLRQDNLGDISNISTQSHFSHGNKLHEKRGLGDYNPRENMLDLLPVYEKVGDALRERIALLEKQLANLADAMERKESEQERTEARLRRTFTELEVYKRACNIEKSQIESSHDRAFVLLKEQHLKEMAGMTSSLSLPDSSHSFRNDTSEDNVGNSESHRRLLLQINVMRLEQRRVDGQFSEERSVIQAESDARLLAQEKTLKVEISELRWQKSALEDRLAQLTEDFTVVHAKAESVGVICRQLEISRDEAVEVQTRLRTDLKAVQSGTSGFRLEGTPSGSTQLGLRAHSTGGTVDFETSTRLNEAKGDAKVRQLTNKLDFLKAQLASEQASAEDLKTAASKDRSKVDELRIEFRLKMQEADHFKGEAVELAERQMELLYTDRMNDYASLQAKAMAVQGQLQIAYQETAAAKQREETARVGASKSATQQIALRTEIDSLRDQLLTLRDERESEAARVGSKHSQDATVRRLDNERQYLKSQLASEITLKNELHEALFQCQQQLGDTQSRWRADVETLKESTTKAVQEASSSQLKSHQIAISLESEVGRLGGQNKDLKEGFSLMRDQVRAEQLTLETYSTANRRMQEHLDALRADGERAKASRDLEGTMQAEQMAALNSLLLQQEEKQFKEKNNLMEELSKQFNANSVSQSENFQLMESFDKERKSSLQQVAAVQLFERIRKMRLFRTQMEHLVRDTLVEAKRVKEVSNESVRKECSDTYFTKSRLQNKENNAELLRQRAAHLEERKAMQLVREEQFEAMTNAEREVTGRQIASIKAAGHDALLVAETVMREEAETAALQQQQETHRLVQKAETRAEAAYIASENALNIEWELKFKALSDEQIASQLLAEEGKNAELAAILADARIEAEAVRSIMLTEQALSVAVAVAAAEKRADTQAADLREQFRIEQDILSEKVRLEVTEEVILSDKERDAHTEMRIRELLSTAALEATELHRLKDLEREEAAADSLLQQALALDAERARGLKLEASKWKQAMRELEKRLELEVNRARADVGEEKDGELLVEVARMEARAIAAAAAMAEEHRVAVESMAREVAERVAATAVMHDAEQRETVQRATAALRVQLEEDHSVRLKAEFAAALEQSTAASNASLVHHDQATSAKMRAIADKMEEELCSLENEGASKLKAETAKWQKLLKEIESKMIVQVGVAKTTGRDEMEVELRTEMEETRRTLQSALQMEVDAAIQLRRKVTETEACLERSILAHEDELQGSVDRLEAQLVQQKRDSDGVHQAAIEAWVLQAEEERETAVLSQTALITSTQQESALLYKQRDLEREEAAADSLLQQALALDAERARGLKLEASKWKQAMRELEKRLELEVNRARADVGEEKDGELLVEVARMEARAIAAAAAMAEEHRVAVESMAREVAERVAATAVMHDAEQRETVQQATAQLEEDHSVRLKAEVAAALEQAALRGDTELQKIQDLMDGIKRDFEAQSQRLAVDRNQTQERIEGMARALSQETAAKEGLFQQQLLDQIKYDASILAICDKHKEEVEHLREQLQSESKAAIAALQEQYAINLKVEADRLDRSLEKQLQQAQEDSIQQIEVLESSVAQLSGDKAALVCDLNAVAKKLEDETDNMYDLQQEVNRKTRVHCLVIWRMAVRVRCLRSDHEDALGVLKEQFHTEAQAKDRALMNLSSTALLAANLSKIFLSVEDIRQKMLDVLHSYRLDDITEKRILVKGLEIELERLTGEKNTIDEQRDDAEEGIQRLEDQVRAVEALLREHTQTSSTQNGRVNAAHARKKKRLDEDFERLLEQIEMRRSVVCELDDLAADKARNRNLKEAEIVDLERQLVQILVEQQKAVLLLAEQGKDVNVKCGDLLKGAKMPWPPLDDPSALDIAALFT